MKLNYSLLFAIPLMVIFTMDNMFMELAAPHDPPSQGALLNLIIRGSAAISFVYSIFYFRRMSNYMKFAFALLTAYVFALVFESKYVYDSFMVYPHVFLKVLLFYYIFSMYTFYKGHYHLKFVHLVYFILIFFWMNAILINPDALSISSFTHHERGIHSTSVYMMVLPLFYFMSNYFYKGGLYNLGMTFFVLLTIFFFQHRTVWVVTAVMLAIYYLLIKFKTPKPINFATKLLPVVTVMLVMGIASSAFLFSIHPEIIDKVMENFSDIENMESQGTGGWRYQQWMSYLPFIQDNFVTGMRFKGFELPIQFYRDDIDKPVFEDGKGHFFHSFYVDVLFYTGMIGLSLFLTAAFRPIYQGIKKFQLTTNQIILFTFVCSGFIFGISYVLPPFYYGVLGLCIVAMEKESVPRQTYLQDFASRMMARRQQGRPAVYF
ncbi:O-antigen ligase family protein [Pontibacter fetidus]|uniref:O-antigen ligase family protein n=1 Tax=Pontibacter fetidus TaxID=2700082 RepID=A0A6B2H5A5_9BACT|nr:O-antigen ligase family protein [Pontibacter fetidus]NDK55856.1 O-antigen ligase family protein [Pontibacter fetidus]